MVITTGAVRGYGPAAVFLRFLGKLQLFSPRFSIPCSNTENAIRTTDYSTKEKNSSVSV